jgi:hypothetical protein
MPYIVMPIQMRSTGIYRDAPMAVTSTARKAFEAALEDLDTPVDTVIPVNLDPPEEPFPLENIDDAVKVIKKLKGLLFESIRLMEKRGKFGYDIIFLKTDRT